MVEVADGDRLPSLSTSGSLPGGLDRIPEALEVFRRREPLRNDDRGGRTVAGV
jgi:hypothetical protein